MKGKERGSGQGVDGEGMRERERREKRSVCQKAGVVFHESHVHESGGWVASGMKGRKVIHNFDTDVFCAGSLV